MANDERQRRYVNTRLRRFEWKKTFKSENPPEEREEPSDNTSGQSERPTETPPSTGGPPEQRNESVDEIPTSSPLNSQDGSDDEAPEVTAESVDTVGESEQRNEPAAMAGDITDSGKETETADDDEIDGSGKTDSRQTESTSTEESLAEQTSAVDDRGTTEEDDLEQADTAVSVDPEPVTSGPLAEFSDALANPDPAEREAAIRDIGDTVEQGASESTAIDLLQDRLESDDATAVRVATCEVLGMFESERAASILRDYQFDPDVEVSRAASRALDGEKT